MREGRGEESVNRGATGRGMAERRVKKVERGDGAGGAGA